LASTTTKRVRAKPKKKPLEAPVKTAIAEEDIDITVKIGGDTYIVELKAWKVTEDNGHSS
jgi:hypothetical protein